jgi:hypothetical protein
MSQTVYSKGILHGLPTLPEHENKKYSIIVTGANGISGSAMLKVLSENPGRWDKIYAMSRRPPTYEENPHIIPIAVDFLDSTPWQIAKVFKDHDVQADYAYFASYIQPPPLEGKGLWSDAEAMTSINLALLQNFLSALDLVKIVPKRTLLQLGGKFYGVHLGPTASPQDESDPRHGIESNFYFPQMDLLHAWTAKHSTEYVETIPGFILGTTHTAAMNIVYPIAVYAAIQAHLSQPLNFPADIPAWLAEKHQSTASLMCYHAEWALLSPKTANQALNHSDGGSFAWGKFWPILASWYGTSAGKPATDPSAYQTITMPFETSPLGFGGPGVIHASFSFLEWSKTAEVKKAWEELVAKYGLMDSPFGEKAQDTFGLIDGEILGGWTRVLNMNKSRKLGWNGFVDTVEGTKEVIEEMAGMKLVPPMRE